MSHVLTLVAARDAGLSPGLIDRVRNAVCGSKPVELSPNEAIDIACDARPDLALVHAALEGEAIDAIVTHALGRRKKLLVADMDGTIVQGETLDMLARHAGCGERVASITARSMGGEIDFAEALRERVMLLRGLDLAAIGRTRAGVRLTEGARILVATMRAHDATTALVSGGFSVFAAPVAQLCGFDHQRSNVLCDDGVALTGSIEEPVLDGHGKLAILRELAAARGLPLSATLAVGDGANDLAMLTGAGLGIAFRAHPGVASAAGNQVRHADLRALLFAQGYPAAMFREE